MPTEIGGWKGTMSEAAGQPEDWVEDLNQVANQTGLGL